MLVAIAPKWAEKIVGSRRGTCPVPHSMLRLRNDLLRLVHTADTDKTRLVRVGGVNTTADKTRQFCLVLTQFPICNCSVLNTCILRITEKLANWKLGRDKTRQSTKITSYILVHSLVLFVSAVWTSYHCDCHSACALPLSPLKVYNYIRRYLRWFVRLFCKYSSTMWDLHDRPNHSVPIHHRHHCHTKMYAVSITPRTYRCIIRRWWKFVIHLCDRGAFQTSSSLPQCVSYRRWR